MNISLFHFEIADDEKARACMGPDGRTDDCLRDARRVRMFPEQRLELVGFDRVIPVTDEDVPAFDERFRLGHPFDDAAHHFFVPANLLNRDELTVFDREER